MSQLTTVVLKVCKRSITGNRLFMMRRALFSVTNFLCYVLLYNTVVQGPEFTTGYLPQCTDEPSMPMLWHGLAHNNPPYAHILHSPAWMLERVVVLAMVVAIGVGAKLGCSLLKGMGLGPEWSQCRRLMRKKKNGQRPQNPEGRKTVKEGGWKYGVQIERGKQGSKGERRS